MRIAIVAPLVTPIAEPQLGGSQALVADLASALTERGHDIDVFAASGSRIEGVHVVDTGVDPARLTSSLFRANGSAPRATDAAVRAFTSVYDAVARGRYDVVHNHAFDAPAIELGPPGCVHTLHLGPDEEIAVAVGAARGATVVCVSESQRAAWERLVRVDAVVRNGVPVDRIPWSAGGGTQALFAGRLSPEKGTAEAIEIARCAGVDIVVLGDAYDVEYAKALRERFPFVDFRPAVARPELWRLMSESAALLCPILWDEPFGLAAAEAQAAGTPVIGFRRGALPEVVVDGVTGALVEDVVQGAEALGDVQRFDRAACRAHAKQTLSLETMVDRYEDVYQRAAVPR
jgi:glycosyltransferase involved in cell wall biosynthesis